MYTCLCCQGETYKKGKAGIPGKTMIRERTARLLHCTREREKDREREIGEETE